MIVMLDVIISKGGDDESKNFEIYNNKKENI